MTQEDLKKFRKELVSGLASLVVLNLMARADGERYGYEIAKELEEKAGDDPLFKQSALYPVLRQLDASGLLSSRVQVSTSGPPRPSNNPSISDRRRSLTLTPLPSAMAWSWSRTGSSTRSVIVAMSVLP